MTDSCASDLQSNDLRVIKPEMCAILDNLSSGMIVIGFDCRLFYLNPVAQNIFSVPEQTMLGVSLCSMLDMASAIKLKQVLGACAAKTANADYSGQLIELELLVDEYCSIPLECVIQNFVLENNKALVLSIRDVSEQSATRNNNRLLSSALENIADSVFITDPRGVIEYVNQGFVAVTGYTKEEVIGGSPSLLSSGHHSHKFYLKLWEELKLGHVFRDVMINRRKDGELYYEEKTITPLCDEYGEIQHYVSTGKDITEQIRTQRRLQYLAQHDLLTGLPNRLLFMDRLTQAIASSKRKKTTVVMMYLGLDRFKNVNDALGHDSGDMLLKEIANRLKASLREGDTVAHQSGDEFAILVPDVNSEEEVKNIVRSVFRVIRKPFELDGHELFFSASMGMAMYPSGGDEPKILAKHAEIAMYQAKQKGGNCSQFYQHDQSYHTDERLMLENELRYAISRGEFSLFYQPQIRNSDHRIVGVEALIRWHHPKKGLILPSSFVPVLEESGMIIEVGQWVMATACHQLKSWHRQGLDIPQVSVNVSSRQLANEDFTEIVQGILVESGLAPEALELEITESYLMHNETRAIEMLKKLGDTGVGLAMDDFGTGFSSLRYLREFPVQTLKIDRDFVKNIPLSSDDCSLASAIVSMGHSLKLNVIAEGVETEEQLSFMQTQGCDVTQGFYFSHPVPAEQMGGMQEVMSECRSIS